MNTKFKRYCVMLGCSVAALAGADRANAVTLRLDFEAAITRINDADAPFDNIATGDVAEGYFEYHTEEAILQADGTTGSGPTSYSGPLVPFQPLTFVKAVVRIGGHTFDSYALGVGQSVQLWDEPATPAGFDQFHVSTLSQATPSSAFNAYMSATATIQLIDALMDEGLVQHFEWSEALEPTRAFLRPFGFEYAEPNSSAVSGRSRLDIVGDLTYARLAPVPLPPALPLFAVGLWWMRLHARRLSPRDALRNEPMVDGDAA